MGGLGHQHDRGLAVYLLALSMKEMMFNHVHALPMCCFRCCLFVAYVLPRYACFVLACYVIAVIELLALCLLNAMTLPIITVLPVAWLTNGFVCLQAYVLG